MKSLTTNPGRAVGLQERRIVNNVAERYLYQHGELEGGACPATDPIWSSNIFKIGRSITKEGQPVLYFLSGRPKRGFVGEEQEIVPPDTELPP